MPLARRPRLSACIRTRSPGPSVTGERRGRHNGGSSGCYCSCMGRRPGVASRRGVYDRVGLTRSKQGARGCSGTAPARSTAPGRRGPASHRESALPSSHYFLLAAAKPRVNPAVPRWGVLASSPLPVCLPPYVHDTRASRAPYSVHTVEMHGIGWRRAGPPAQLGVLRPAGVAPPSTHQLPEFPSAQRECRKAPG